MYLRDYCPYSPLNFRTEDKPKPNWKDIWRQKQFEQRLLQAGEQRDKEKQWKNTWRNKSKGLKMQ